MSALEATALSRYCLRDPQQTHLGQKIVAQGIALLAEIGLEQFSFKRLAQEVHTTEASVYRYFENKHQLMQYLSEGFWCDLSTRLSVQAALAQTPEQQLELQLHILVEAYQNLQGQIIPVLLASEGPSPIGLQSVYRQMQVVIVRVNPHYPYPRTLITTLLEAARQQAVCLRLGRLDQGDLQRQGPFSRSLMGYLKHLAISLLQPEAYLPGDTPTSAPMGDILELVWAASRGDLQAIRDLERRGVPLNSHDYDGRTALHLAAAEGQLEVVRYLAGRIPINEPDRWGGTPLQDARASGHEAVCRLLESLGAA